jgi:hypothetical protein
MFPVKITEDYLSTLLKIWCALGKAGEHEAVKFNCAKFFSIRGLLDITSKKVKKDPDVAMLQLT